ncbi:hypothetical protein PK69_04950 [Xanthomonas phaseoli pv. phaseoli]|uniref:Uncharacterized protein n=2 Tax=Xanthomonas phaseoli TaxID=1985254 RepID=A0AB34QFJ2_XANCH|nr:hypothetical protein AC609_10725 [Xanthomonas phaseoli pv. phaseoli]AZU32525.1 hypothetical protein AC801_23065 [Xanthomonas sp. ISO98C4]KUF21331.1 hypothetical protein AO826_14540 [Xanthomonas phaseoli pv. manihotis]OQP80349.1 hypothetical protein IM53_008080 [Xanthomonas phaseoli pv. dieffenbachiae]AZU25921.1 hypothetical protein AC611_10730 [Xanthomonas phaseoli pv. phaseoli]
MQAVLQRTGLQMAPQAWASRQVPFVLRRIAG